jgi:succinate dehydrogenase / fumarate reductase, membrane anchor subunit
LNVARSATSARAAVPRTLREARTTYQTNGELGWWVFMRLSGFLLVFLTFAHLYANNIAFNVGEVDYDYVASRLAQPAVRVFDSFLLLFAMLHGVNGLRYSIEDYVRRPGARFWWKAVLFVVAGMVFVLGLMALWTFSFSEMGDAVRALNE